MAVANWLFKHFFLRFKPPLCAFQVYDVVEFKHCQITRTDSGKFNLSGTKRNFGSVHELLGCYQNETVRSDSVVFQFSKCCPPKAKGNVRFDVRIYLIDWVFGIFFFLSGLKTKSVLTPVIGTQRTNYLWLGYNMTNKCGTTVSAVETGTGLRYE